ncbi:MAG: cytochrome c biogenesis protein CcsA [Bacteroidales bacterium]|nr:cytochrome c biogenesis protein CcsA [Bacteroidales bacterium]MDD2425895.1 cytochrome c biogenesis protein CcsA [Bacteroidales bacterium]MDD3990149.1 cytochrome c biogenesis protein CcsA [Bacteroidales bacterium]MDD4639178.1 cytochrome c biogenesis protein CcsA [Bacteroidales bacterium]
MIWHSFIYFAGASLLMWIAGTALLYVKSLKRIPEIVIICGMLIFCSFIYLLWDEQGYPPLRTIGETRLWYSLFIIVTGFLTYRRWKYRWLIGYSVFVSAVFIAVNVFKPEIHHVNLMPALQSRWFIPHVTVYIISYALMGAAAITAVAALIRHKSSVTGKDHLVLLTDNLINTGLAFLMAGILMGALWAKEAWGDFWTWDPKEVWAFITAAVYILYIHCRIAGYKTNRILLIVPIALLCLLITWLGVEYLPIAQESIHSY